MYHQGAQKYQKAGRPLALLGRETNARTGPRAEGSVFFKKQNHSQSNPKCLAPHLPFELFEALPFGSFSARSGLSRSAAAAVVTDVIARSKNCIVALW